MAKRPPHRSVSVKSGIKTPQAVLDQPPESLIDPSLFFPVREVSEFPNTPNAPRWQIREKQKRALIRNLVLSGGNVTLSCRLAGINRWTYYDWYGKDKRIQKAMALALKNRTKLMVDAVFESGVAGSVSAQKYWLNNRDSKNWKPDSKIEESRDDEEADKLIGLMAEAVAAFRNSAGLKSDPRKIIGNMSPSMTKRQEVIIEADVVETEPEPTPGKKGRRKP